MSTLPGVNLDELGKAAQMLQALRDPTRSDHVLALQALETNISQGPFVLLILTIFAYGHAYEHMGLSVDLRQLAGLITKNYVFPRMKSYPTDLQQALMTALLHALSDPLLDVRKTSAILIGKISETFPITTWIEVLVHIIQSLDAANLEKQPYLLDGAIYAIKSICEDSSMKLSLDSQYRSLENLIPKLLALLQCPDSSIQIRALESYNCLLYLIQSPDTDSYGYGNGHMNLANALYPITMNIRNFIEILSSLSTSTVSEIRRLTCQSITIITTLDVSLLSPYFASLCQFMLQAINDHEERVAIEACEFWIALVHTTTVDTTQTHEIFTVITPYIATLIKQLIQRLYLTAEQLEVDRREEYESAQGNTTLQGINLQPSHYKNHQQSHSSHSNRYDHNNNTMTNHWTVRKQAAYTLDILSTQLPVSMILSAALPVIQEYFSNSDLLFKESGLLALGALSNGCTDEMTIYLPQLYPFLLATLQDTTLLNTTVNIRKSQNIDNKANSSLQTNPMINNNNNLLNIQYNADTHSITTNIYSEIVSISCWVLSRYSRLFGVYEDPEQMEPGMIVAFTSQQGREMYLSLLHALITLLQNTTMCGQYPKLQVAAASALCVLIEHSFVLTALDANSTPENILTPYLSTIFHTVTQCFTYFGMKSTLILIDIITVLVEAIDATVVTQYTSIYLPTLMQYFIQINDEQQETRIFPVLECFTSIFPVLQGQISEYSVYLYTRVSELAYSSLLSLQDTCNAKFSSISSDAPTNSKNKVNDNEEDDDDHGGDNMHEQEEMMLFVDYSICCIDVLSALSEALTTQYATLLYTVHSNTTSNNNTAYNPTLTKLFTIVLLAIQYPDVPTVRQSGFSLLGELLKNIFPSFLVYSNNNALVQNTIIHTRNNTVNGSKIPNYTTNNNNNNNIIEGIFLQRIIEVSLQNLDPTYPYVCNNAAWSIGELIIQMYTHTNDTTATVSPKIFSKYVYILTELLTNALTSTNIEDNLKVNIAITFGRLALINTIEVAEMAEDFFADWCSVLAFECPISESAQAFKGLVLVLHTHSSLLSTSKSNLYAFLNAVSTYAQTLLDHTQSNPSDPLSSFYVEVSSQLKEILHTVKNYYTATTGSGNLWKKAFSAFKQQQEGDIVAFSTVYQI